jgi:hypothetical protein
MAINKFMIDFFSPWRNGHKVRKEERTNERRNAEKELM